MNPTVTFIENYESISVTHLGGKIEYISIFTNSDYKKIKAERLIAFELGLVTMIKMSGKYGPLYLGYDSRGILGWNVRTPV